MISGYVGHFNTEFQLEKVYMQTRILSCFASFIVLGMVAADVVTVVVVVIAVAVDHDDDDVVVIGVIIMLVVDDVYITGVFVMIAETKPENCNSLTTLKYTVPMQPL